MPELRDYVCSECYIRAKTSVAWFLRTCAHFVVIIRTNSGMCEVENGINEAKNGINNKNNWIIEAMNKNSWIRENK